jgi:hypothetical protein
MKISLASIAKSDCRYAVTPDQAVALTGDTDRTKIGETGLVLSITKMS